MNDEINYKANPLHGVGLKDLLIELVNHYGFNILFAYLNINCFKSNASIDSSVKFLKKADWAREKVEAFYMYQFKNLPKASDEQFQFPPRDRIVPKGQKPGNPAILSLEDAAGLHEKRVKKAAAYRSGSSSGKKYGTQAKNHYSSNRNNENTRSEARKSSKTSSTPDSTGNDPWAKWRK
jgi:uncharacterized protein (DUF2132 family)